MRLFNFCFFFLFGRAAVETNGNWVRPWLWSAIRPLSSWTNRRPVWTQWPAGNSGTPFHASETTARPSSWRPTGTAPFPRADQFVMSFCLVSSSWLCSVVWNFCSKFYDKIGVFAEPSSPWIGLNWELFLRDGKLLHIIRKMFLNGWILVKVPPGGLDQRICSSTSRDNLNTNLMAATVVLFFLWI